MFERLSRLRAKAHSSPYLVVTISGLTIAFFLCVGGLVCMGNWTG